MRHSRQDRASAISLVMMIVIGLPLGAVIGQQLVIGGNALDNNLRMGSGGYNRTRPNANYMAGQRYAPGQSKPLYVVGATGEMVYSPNNAFFPQSRYTAVGHQATYQQPGWHSRFRYQTSGRGY